MCSATRFAAPKDLTLPGYSAERDHNKEPVLQDHELTCSPNVFSADTRTTMIPDSEEGRRAGPPHDWQVRMIELRTKQADFRLVDQAGASQAPIQAPI